MIAGALRFQVGARTLASIPRRLERVALSLDDALAARCPALPPLPTDADGYLVTSLPEAHAAALRHDRLIASVRQHYTRYHLDLTIGEAAWRAGLSGQTRSTLKRKAKKLAQESGGALDIRAYRTPEDLAAFVPFARQVSATTYQERLLDAGLPADAASQARMAALAAADAVRAWLLFVRGRPVAYLWCSAQGSALRYDYVGHDPAFAPLSPGSVLMEAALTALFTDRFARFDFTEGEGQHKRGLATGGVACVDVLLLRPTLANRAALGALGAFDAAMARAKHWADAPAFRGLAKRVRRA